MTESLRYLIGNISRIMDYYISRHTDTNFDSIVCCGLGARVKGLMLLLTNELGQQVDVLQELEDFALLAAVVTHRKPAFYAAVLSSGTSGVKPDGQGQQEEERKERDFERCHHYLCGRNSGRSCADSCRICKPYLSAA